MSESKSIDWRAGGRALFARVPDPYAGADLELARRFARLTWLIATVLTLVLVVLYPPTRAFGEAGWYVAFGTLAANIGGFAIARRDPERVTFTYLYVATCVALLQLGLLQWLAGGRVAPFHEFLLFQIIGMALTHPPRRFAGYMAAELAVAFAPALYAPDSAQMGEIVTEQLLWFGLGVFLLLLMRNLRAQRVALREAGQEAQQLARVDTLTRLGNRRAFDEALAEALVAASERGGQLSLLVADLINFKQVNDGHGHVVGDHCLRQVADALRDAIRDSDACFRWGGDEFAVLVGSDSDDVAALAERVELSVRSSCRTPDGRPIAVRCGHAQIDGTATPDQAVAAADAVLLDLKRGGREVIFTPPATADQPA
jgi:diguanylate cyclase (GGDEF)-like protein